MKVEKEFEVLDDIKEYVYELHNRYDMAGSTWDWHYSFLYKKGKKIGRVSYNVRVWDMENDESEILG